MTATAPQCPPSMRAQMVVAALAQVDAAHAALGQLTRAVSEGVLASETGKLIAVIGASLTLLRKRIEAQK